MLNFQWPVWESESDNTKFNTPAPHSHLRPCNTNESHVLHPQDVFVVLKCIVGVFSRPLGVVMFTLCVCVCVCVQSLYLSHS